MGIRLFFVAGILFGIPGLAPENRKNSSDQPAIVNVFSQSTAQAKENVESVGLNEWPDLFDGTKESQPIQPSSSTGLLTSTKNTSSFSLSAPSKKIISPPHDEGIPSLHSTLTDEGVEKHVRVSSFEETSETPKVPAKIEPVAAISTETPSTVRMDSHKAPVIAAADSENKEPNIAKSQTEDSVSVAGDSTPKKGFVIKVEGEGKDLVVYDANGKEVLRKSRKRETPGTTISGSGKTLTNRNEPNENQAPVSEVAKTTPKPKADVKQKPTEAKSRIVFDEIKKGENLSLIASRYPGVTADDLMRVNQIDDPHCIAAGSKIWVPAEGQNGLCHRVEKHETLSSLLKKYEIKNMFKVCDLNGLNYYSTNKLEEGQLLVIPDAVAKNHNPRTHTARAIRSDTSKLKGSTRWQWPVADDFKISSRWGRRVDPFSKRSKARAGGPKPRFSMHHGIDLAIPVGTPVYAARDGEVIEISRSRYGHGNMIKVRHDDGWCTVYSHNSKLLKSEGDRVKQGDVIAHSGNSGRSTGPHLHFEVRRPNQESVDPKNLLPTL